MGHLIFKNGSTTLGECLGHVWPPKKLVNNFYFPLNLDPVDLQFRKETTATLLQSERLCFHWATRRVFCQIVFLVQVDTCCVLLPRCAECTDYLLYLQMKGEKRPQKKLGKWLGKYSRIPWLPPIGLGKDAQWWGAHHRGRHGKDSWIS